MLKFKSLYFFLVFLSLAFTSKAQFGWVRAIDEIEVVTGLSSVSFGGKKWEANKIKIGYSAGVGIAWNVRDRMSISTKLLAEGKGIKFSYGVHYYDDAMQEHEGNVTDITNLNYLSLPITFRYFLDEHGKFSIEAGPYASYLFKAQAVSEFSWRSTEKYNRKDAFKEFDFGATISLGYKIPIKKKASLRFWLNASYGFVNIGEPSGASGFLNVKNESFGFGLSLVREIKP